jgi:hypothetical protein
VTSSAFLPLPKECLPTHLGSTPSLFSDSVELMSNIHGVILSIHHNCGITVKATLHGWFPKPSATATTTPPAPSLNHSHAV